MKEVHKSEYWVIFFVESEELLNPVWNLNSENLTEELYKEEMREYVSLVEKYKPKRLLIDCRELLFPIEPSIQEWIDENIFPRVLAVGVNLVAIVLPTEFIANLSILQAMEESEGLKFSTQYFDDSDKARTWLTK